MKLIMLPMAWLLTFVTFTLVAGLQYNAFETDYNLNQNKTATNPLDYWGERDGHTYTESPTNWRFPFYSIMLDRYVNGDPTNDNANNTIFEQDIMSNQLRHGGDLKGLVDSLDYIAGMGIKGIYIAGSPFINQPWGADSYSPLDLTLLDYHFGTIAEWQNAVDEIHARGMWVILDHTMATMGDLIGFEDYLNSSTPFSVKEWKATWKSSRRYLDFEFGNKYNETCAYPEFWFETGYPVASNVTSQLKGCYDSDFDQYGDIEAFGVHPDWQRELAKFASVQDRLREWVPSVRAKLERFTCMMIATLDIDGFRIDKGVQVTVDAQAAWSSAVRTCARQYNKTNFFIPGEITSGNNLGSIYVGRGRRPDQVPSDVASAMELQANSSSNSKYFVRDVGENALDGGAFHYSVYRYLTRFLGMDGNLESGYDLPRDWVETWNQMVLTNDFYNANNGEFDPRHMYGVTNQDVFRWPGIDKGIERMLLGHFITTIMLPGIPLMFYGEEQAFYVMDSTATNYVYGRQAMSAALAWKLHGCYVLGSEIFAEWPATSTLTGCLDDAVAYDHRDPSHPIRNIFKHMFDLRTRSNLKVLNDGWLLQPLAKQTSYTLLNGSTVTTEFGVWSVARAMYSGVQNTTGNASTPVWLVYHNKGNTTTYSFDCSDSNDAFISPFDSAAVVKNLFSPFDEITLESSAMNSGFTAANSGCISSITLAPYEFRAYVPLAEWAGPPPMITKFEPGHDVPLDSNTYKGVVPISLHFSEAMSSCDDITAAITIASTVEGTNATASIDSTTVQCSALSAADGGSYTGSISTAYAWSASLKDVADGVHSITIANLTTAKGVSVGTIDKFLIRVGQQDNPVVWPFRANYSSTLLTSDSSGALYVNHRAPGATQWRYSTNWGSTWSDWIDYTKGGTPTKVVAQAWSGTDKQAWEGSHIMVQYFSAPLGSSSFLQHGEDMSAFPMVRRFPHMFLQGEFNKWGYDSGVQNEIVLVDDSTWEVHYMDEWPSSFQINVWGVNPDQQPDQSWVFGDVIGNGIANRLPPPRLPDNSFNISGRPPYPALSYRLVLNDATYTLEMFPQGNQWVQVGLFIILAFVPLLVGIFATWVFFHAFYRVKVNENGFTRLRSLWPFAGITIPFLGLKRHNSPAQPAHPSDDEAAIPPAMPLTPIFAAPRTQSGRRTVLLATMEYNIDDWDISIRIGGLGAMAKLMSTALTHLDIIWVVPCVRDVEYPIDQPADPMYVTCLGQQYEVNVQYHKPLGKGSNITYVILDAPIFRKQTSENPYHARMDDIESAILYATWNACIAETIRRFPRIDIYHMNDYHGAAAPLHLLPEQHTIPCCLSLHNAEFQGMWPMRNSAESKEVCDVFGLSLEIVKQYVQYGSAFNLLHAGASYLRIHQHGFGAVGVSKKYGDRSLARYPIFWSLKNIGHLPNPDPSDTADWNPEEAILNEKKAAHMPASGIEIDEGMERERKLLRKQAQAWAGLDINENAELFIFAGRWSLQKGVDLIADIFPYILEKFPNTQLICVGPIIDLHGKFAALKLKKIAEMYPRRVFVRSEFTQLPPFVFGGAEFALIPSRDEPFGLVAVEFGRKGALGVGARVGGLGQMPGFWYTIESTSPQHLLTQFRKAILSALASSQENRASMRAYSAKQRFPVAQWVQRMEELHVEAIRIHTQEAEKKPKLPRGRALNLLQSPSSAVLSMASRRSSRMPQTDSMHIRDSQIRADSQVRDSHLRDLPLRDSMVRDSMLRDSMVRDSRSELPRPEFGTPNRNSRSEFPSPSPSRTPSPPISTSIMSPNGDSSSMSPAGEDGELFPPEPPFAQHRNSSQISLEDVVGDRNDLKLQKVDAFFTDSTGEYYSRFEKMLGNLNSSNAQHDLCIAAYLKRGEKEWFSRYRQAKLGVDSRRGSKVFTFSSQNNSDFVLPMDSNGNTPAGSPPREVAEPKPDPDDEFLLGNGYQPPTGLKRLLSIRIRDWPVYSFLLAAGQVISSNSYQIVLLTGETGQASSKLYIIGGTYIATSLGWWIMVRRFKSVYALSLPWLFYGLAFMFLGAASFIGDWVSRGQVQDVATAFYAAAASSGAVNFALNFGDESGAPTRQWATRAMIVTGVGQLYSAALWYWGSLMTDPFHPTGSANGNIGASTVPKGIVIAIPIAILLWGVGIVLYLGLPDYYRQSPETIPGYYVSLLRRKTVPWFFVMVIIQNYWLSQPYGRSWEFLFSSQHVPGWAIFLLAVLFFGVFWSAIMIGFTRVSNTHPWLLPMFATGLGLGAPRWAQTLWGTSGIGLYVPWAGNDVASAIVSRLLWLWLGLLDTVQIVGVGMTLMATLTRQHVMGVLVGSQVIGGAATMVARATSPNAFSPSATFPDFTQGLYPGITAKYFWVCLIMQLIIPFGFFKFFRKEQVTKP